MARLYTRGGDDGTTSLADGTRVRKDDPRVEACGAIDEADATVGMARALSDDEMLREILRFAQQRLSNCAALVAAPATASTTVPEVSDADVAALEDAVDELQERTGALDHFIIPGGSPSAAALHVARTSVRRAERRVVALGEGATHPDLLRFLNRLSDLLFAAARWANVDQNRKETAWDAAAGAPDVARFRGADRT
jgi:cob(I)alamin adenosyltransferase